MIAPFDQVLTYGKQTGASNVGLYETKKAPRNGKSIGRAQNSADAL